MVPAACFREIQELIYGKKIQQTISQSAQAQSGIIERIHFQQPPER
jgi:hypothetical protein